MTILLRILLMAFGVVSLLPAGAQTPAGDAVSDFDFAVDAVERAYAGYPDKTANRGAEYAALKERLRSGIASGRDTYDAVAEYLGWFDDSHLGTEVLIVSKSLYRIRSRNGCFHFGKVCQCIRVKVSELDC